MRKSIMLSSILAVTLVLGMASQAFAVPVELEPVTAKLKCDAQLKLSDAQICDAKGCLDVVYELNEELGTNHSQIQQFKLECAQAISATVALAQAYCSRRGRFINFLTPPSTVPSASGEIVNFTALCQIEAPK